MNHSTYLWQKELVVLSLCKSYSTFENNKHLDIHCIYSSCLKKKCFNEVNGHFLSVNHWVCFQSCLWLNYREQKVYSLSNKQLLQPSWFILRSCRSLLSSLFQLHTSSMGLEPPMKLDFITGVVLLRQTQQSWFEQFGAGAYSNNCRVLRATNPIMPCKHS